MITSKDRVSFYRAETIQTPVKIPLNFMAFLKFCIVHSQPQEAALQFDFTYKSIHLIMYMNNTHSNTGNAEI